MCKLAGNCKLFLLLFLLPLILRAQPQQPVGLRPTQGIQSQIKLSQPDSWNYYSKLALDQEEADRTQGLSYIISGSLAILGGIAGTNVTADPLEKGIYALFQTIGVASVGYGSHKYFIGDEKRLLMRSLRESTDLNNQQKVAFLKIYLNEKKKNQTKENYIKVVTHGLIAAMNIYNASLQQQGSVKNALYFIGGANLLASISFAF